MKTENMQDTVEFLKGRRRSVRFDTVIGYVHNDGGRSRTRKGKGNDCVVRALSILTGVDYEECYKAVNSLNKSRYGKGIAVRGTEKSVTDTVFKAFGLKKVSRPKGEKWLTYTEAYEQYGNCIVRTRKHVAAIVGGDLHDTFDGRRYVWEDGEIRERKASTIWVLNAGW